MTLDTVLLETNPRKFIYNLQDFITDPNIGGVGPEDLEKAPSLVRGTIYLSAFNLTIVNSGSYGWILDLYDDYPTLAEFFDRIQAKRAAAYVRAALALFPNGRVPKSLDERLELGSKYDAVFNSLDQRFTGASEEAIAKLRVYIIDHKKVYESQVQAFWKIRKANHRLFERRLARLRRKELGPSSEKVKRGQKRK